MSLFSQGKTHSGRNLGPNWGYRFLFWMDGCLPAAFNRFALRLGGRVAAAFLPEQRRHSKEYLRAILGRQPTRREVGNHFSRFAECFFLRLQVGNGKKPDVDFAEGNGTDFMELIRSRDPALFGTVHVGHSDLVGFYLSQLGRKIHMVRLKVGNSEDLERLAERFSEFIQFIWINNSEEMFFALKKAAQEGCSLAMQCDRVEYSSRTDVFDFLGKQRLFPVTIYHLSLILDLPVVMSVAVPVGPSKAEVYTTDRFQPDRSASRDENLARGRVHFQAFLRTLESILDRDPYLWFNFLPLNPAIDSPTALSPHPTRNSFPVSDQNSLFKRR
ncbi:MAG: hypothetical protein WD490_10865 [Opitutales bacterium]